jgi:hypothetical protein
MTPDFLTLSHHGTRFSARSLLCPRLDAAEPAEAWHGVVFLANAKTMEMEVRPVEADLQDDVKIGEGAVGSYEKAPPEPTCTFASIGSAQETEIYVR